MKNHTNIYLSKSLYFQCQIGWTIFLVIIMPISLRRAKIDDFIQLQNANLHCLAENYHMWFWLYHYLLTPQGAHVAVDKNSKILGYVLGKMDDEGRKSKPPVPLHGAITSVAVFTSYRKLGLATKLLSYTHKTLRECYKAEFVNLHVRETNRAGHFLYQRTLGYKFNKLDEKYYADGENAWSLRYTYPECDTSHQPKS
ncbi:acetyltransferase, GNAT family protein [Tritrichomonas foetus]|uniref:Acetyltransferase, GNAT family protein n=1 Tax=Tritrichomonas foetus TaxID=1144522 RepID=A0A1J4KW32_9EUKA|nr:acetyltransferase, GNAT family protein [Tritrichomonas foetus]|eukprot:OHT15346.1 acetyltransferase, GNAT family protein [Tritrichomonas foetus]